MKLFGNSKGSRHNGSVRKSGALVKAVIIILVLAAALAAAGLAYYKTAVKPPDVTQSSKKAQREQEQPDGKEHPDSSNISEQTGDSEESTDRTGEKYTFLLLVLDKESNNTDGIMACTFDTADYSLEVVSIPRDTMVNVSWGTKKANTLYSSGGIDNLKENFADILGYEVDFYVIMNFNTIESIVDAVGGVEFDVPQDMKYSDPYQDLYIDISEGKQVLSGEDAVKLMRFRKYVQADIKRIEVTQDFLKAMAGQVVQNADSIPIATIADIIVNDVKTDLSYGNIIWFAKELFKLDMENVGFYTLPGDYGDGVYQKGTWESYVSIYVDEWLQMVNEHLNPFPYDITIDDVDILTRNENGSLYATSCTRKGNASWGA